MKMKGRRVQLGHSVECVLASMRPRVSPVGVLPMLADARRWNGHVPELQVLGRRVGWNPCGGGSPLSAPQGHLSRRPTLTVRSDRPFRRLLLGRALREHDGGQERWRRASDD